MKKYSILLFFIISVFLFGCIQTSTPLAEASPNGLPNSNISVDECYLCGPQQPFEIVERPHDTLLLLCLNTWDLRNTRMHDYDENGNDDNYSGATILRNTHHSEHGCSWSFASNTGYHTCKVSIRYGSEAYLNLEALATQLCPECLTKAYDISFFENTHAYCDVLYNTADGSIYPIHTASDFYHIDNYWIHVDHDQEHKTDTVYIVYNPDSTK